MEEVFARGESSGNVAEVFICRDIEVLERGTVPERRYRDSEIIRGNI